MLVLRSDVVMVGQTDVLMVGLMAASMDFRWAVCSADYLAVLLVADLVEKSVVVMVASWAETTVSHSVVYLVDAMDNQRVESMAVSTAVMMDAAMVET